MKKTVFIAMLLMFGLVVMAHPPKKVSLTFDKATGKLTVVAEHGVKDSKTHYIEKAYVMINDVEVKVEEYTEQTNTSEADLLIDLPNVKSGDIVKVKAKCNKSGARAAEIKIE